MKILSTIVADIEKYLREFEELGVKTFDDLKDRKNFYSASMVLFTIFNRTIDLGQEIVLRKRLGTPATYKEIFRLLEANGLIKKELLNQLEEIVDLRNRLSHEYFAFTREDVFKAMRKLKAVKDFLRVVRK